LPRRFSGCRWFYGRNATLMLGLRRRIASRGRERALDFAWPRITDRIEEVYRQAYGRRYGIARVG